MARSMANDSSMRRTISAAIGAFVKPGDLEKVPPPVRPARRLDDRRGLSVFGVERIVARVGVGLQDARPASENPARMFAMARGGVVEQNRRRSLAAERPVIADVMRWTVPAPGGTIAG